MGLLYITSTVLAYSTVFVIGWALNTHCIVLFDGANICFPCRVQLIRYYVYLEKVYKMNVA